MPILQPMRGLALAALLSLAGACAAPPDKRAAAPEPATPSVAAVRAFADICGRLDESEVTTRAARYGFAALPAERVAAVTPDTLRGRDLRILVRPGGQTPAMLFWTGRSPSCELGIGGLDAAAVEAEFDSFVRSLAAQPGLAVTSVPPEADRTGPMRLRRAVLVAPSALLPAAPRAFALRVNDDQAQALQISLATRELASEPAPAPADKWLPKQ